MVARKMKQKEIFHFVLVWFLSFVILLSLDMIWFWFVMDTLYRPLFFKIQKRIVFRIGSGLIVWMLLGLMVALTLYQSAARQWSHAGLMGILYGLIIYGVYNFTNYATLYHYNLRVVAIDTMWGGVVMGITSFFMAILHNHLSAR